MTGNSRGAPTTEPMMLARIGIQNLVPLVTPRIADIKRNMGKLPKQRVLTTMSGLGVLFRNESQNQQELEIKLREQFLAEIHIERLKKFDAGAQGKARVFDTLSFLQILHIARETCLDSEVDIEEPALRRQIGSAFLMMNSILNRMENPADASKEALHDFLQRLTPRQFLFNNSEQFRYLLPRAWLVFQHLKDQVPEEDYFDVDGFLKKTFGFSLEELFQSTLCVHAHWRSESLHEWRKQESFNIDSLFKPCILDTTPLKKCIQFLGQPAAISTSFPSEKNLEEVRKFSYSHLGLRKSPLLEYEGRYFCSLYAWVEELFWSGPFHLVLTHEKDRKVRDRFLHFLGRSTEIYIQHLLRWAFGPRFSTPVLKDKTPLADGVLELRKDWLVVIEAKAARPSLSMMTSDNPFHLQDDFKKLLKSGLVQIDKRISEYRKESGFTGRITPVLVTVGIIPQNEILWEGYKAEMKEVSLLAGAGGTDFPILATLECFEGLVAVENAGIGIAKAIEGKLAVDWKYRSLADFFHLFFFRSLGIEEPRNELLIQVFNWMYSELSFKLFGKRPEASAGGTDWQKHFKKG